MAYFDGRHKDPFEIDFNVARCVTKDGLYTVHLSRLFGSHPWIH